MKNCEILKHVIRVYPLSFAEFYSVYDGEYEDAWNDYMIYGGLPQVAGFQTERQISYTNKTISKHIDYLEEAFLISKSHRYDMIPGSKGLLNTLQR